MNFNERVQSVVSAEMERQLELFQEATDRTSDMLKLLQRLNESIPLIQDIKSEVAEMLKQLQAPKPEEDSDEEKDRKPYDPHEDDVLREFIEDLTNQTLNLEQFYNILRIEGPNLPVPFGSGKSGNSKPRDSSAVRTFFYIYRKIKDLRDSIAKDIEDNLAGSNLDSIKSSLMDLQSRLKLLEKTFDDFSDAITQSLEECCSNLNEQLSSCCESMGLKLDKIESKLDGLDPEVAKDKDLSLQNKARAILSEVQTIRGYL